MSTSGDVVVGSRSSSELRIPVSTGHFVQWTVSVASHDVKLSVTMLGEGRKRVPVVDALRVNKDTNSYQAPFDGTVLVVFDNGFSMLRNKTVTYDIKVVTAEAAAEADMRTAWDINDVDMTNTQALIGVDLFFNNRFDESERFFEAEANRLPVFALGHCVLAFFRAMMTFAKGDIDEVTRRVKHAQALSSRYMRKASMWSSIFGSSRPDLSPTELEALLVNAESHLLHAVVYLMDESLIGFLQSGLTVRSGWKLYRQCDAAMGNIVTSMKAADGSTGMHAGVDAGLTKDDVDAEALDLGDEALAAQAALLQAELEGVVDADGAPADAGEAPAVARAEGEGNAPTDVSDVTVDAAEAPAAGAGAAAAAPTLDAPGTASILDGLEDDRAGTVRGVLFGVGGFNVLLSILPPIVLRLCAALGFPHSRAVGMEQMRQCFLAGGIRGPIAGLVMLGMHVVLPSFYSDRLDLHVPIAEMVLQRALSKYPDGALFLWMAGRLHRMKRELPQAIEMFERCRTCVGKGAWAQLQHLCLYDIGWAHCFSLRWADANPLFATLQAENKWSKAFYAYMQAMIFLEMGDVASATAKMADVPSLCRRKVAGKLIPPEQYAMKRAGQFNNHGSDDPSTTLMLPGYEHIVLNRGFHQMSADTLRECLAVTDRVLANLTAGIDDAGVPRSAEEPPAPSAAAPGSFAALLDAATEGCATIPRWAPVATDRVALVALCRGSILSQLGDASREEAAAMFRWVIAHQAAVSPTELHVVGFSMFGLGAMTDDVSLFKAAKAIKRDFSFKMRLHFRIHGYEQERNAHPLK